MVVVFLNQIQYERCGMSASAIGGVYIAVTLAGTLGAFSDKLTQKIGIKESGILLYAAAIISCLILGSTRNAVLSVCGVLMLNVVNSLFQPFQLEQQNRQVLSENRATELSVYAIMVNCVCTGTSVLFGVFAKIALEAAFYFGAGICFAGLLLFVLWGGKTGFYALRE